MSRLPPRFVAAAGPVNRRTAGPAKTPVAVSPIEQDRIDAARKRIQLGAPLAEQMRRRPGRSRLERKHVLAALLAAAAIALLFLAGVQQTLWLFAAAIVILVVAGLALQSRREAEVAATPTAWLPESALHAFDSVLLTLANDIDPPHRDLLCEIKSAVIAIANTATVSTNDEHFNPDDRHYLIECLRRYIPDSLTAYLAIPKTQRAVVVATSTTTAADLLTQQLALLRDELRRREIQAARNATTDLLRQQRFLDSKRNMG